MRKNAGVFSYSFIVIGIVLGAVFLLLDDWIIGGIYVAIVLVSVYLLVMNYCRKCPHSMNDTCHHGLPGRIAKKLPYKKTGKYTWIELVTIITAIFVSFIFPIVFLLDHRIVLAIYLIFWLIGVLSLRRRVCPNCYNRWCVICPNRVH